MPGADKAVHVGLFLLLTGTAVLRFGARPSVLALSLAYAAGSELVQAAALAERSGDAWDLLADGVGAAAGWRLARHGLRRLSPRR